MTTARTIYPTNGEYNIAVANLGTFARDPRLAQAQPQRLPNGGLAAYSGGYSRVYPVKSGPGTFALRCWTADVGEARERYRQIAAYLAGQTLPYFVAFEYLDDALVVKGTHYPVLWMEWAEGLRLRDYVRRHLGNRDALHALAEEFREMVAALHAAGISHGDLQDENIIVRDGPGGPRLRLIDYDSLFVPALGGYSDQIIGVSHYQHPRRNTLRTASNRVDYFSELVIYLSLLAYAQNPGMFDPQAEKQLLFLDSDFADPARSRAFQAIRFMTGEVRVLTDRLVEFCREGDLLRLQPLETVTAGIGGGTVSRPSTTLSTLDETFLQTPAAAPKPSTPQPTRVNIPGGFLSGASDPPPPPSTPVNVPGDFLGQGPPAAPQSPPQAPRSPQPPPATPASSRPGGSAGWDAFYEGARRTSRSRPGAVVLAASPAATPAKRARAGPGAPAPPPPPFPRDELDWPAVARGFTVGILLILLVIALVYALGAAAPPIGLAGTGAASDGPVLWSEAGVERETPP